MKIIKEKICGQFRGPFDSQDIPGSSRDSWIGSPCTSLKTYLWIDENVVFVLISLNLDYKMFYNLWPSAELGWEQT